MPLISFRVEPFLPFLSTFKVLKGIGGFPALVRRKIDMPPGRPENVAFSQQSRDLESISL
ncbi:hypothetical protein [Burkholderia gladioli]|uniref:hypothetical protein n=1 Tax=Burkholderia gladioli TaxID=28095 RepID=UPI0016421C97|nr:hypothetical protein [Burkholderia gladioli]